MRIQPPNRKVQEALKKYGLRKKFLKQIAFFEQNPFHPSLHTEKLEPHDIGLYSFRLDRTFRAIFRIRDGGAEILLITKHYRKA